MAWKYSVLVVANITATSPELIEALRERAGHDACKFALLIPAPSGGSAGREAAQSRLDEVLDSLRAQGLEVDGQVGDHDPVVAFHELWDPQGFDEVIVSTLPTGSSRWLAIDLPHRFEKISGVPVAHVVAQPPRPPVKVERVEEPERYGILSPFAALLGRRQ
jgi:GABA permease